MSQMKLFLSIILTVTILIVQVGGVFAAPALQDSTLVSGTVQRITRESDPTTGVITIIIELLDSNQATQTVRVSQETAIGLGLVVLDGDGNPVINEMTLGKTVEIDPATVLPDEQQNKHPVGNALATFFSNIEGIDYDTIMSAHDDGVGFGVIAQALWLTSELSGNSQLFQDLLYAKEHNDYSAFSDFTEDSTTPKSWGQLRKALLNKKSLGLVISNHDNNGNHVSGNGNNKDKNKDKNNNSHGNGNGNNRNGNGPGR